MVEHTGEFRTLVAEAMQAAWDDFVADTGCFPDCFHLQGRILSADFERGNFATFVAGWLNAKGVHSGGDERG